MAQKTNFIKSDSAKGARYSFTVEAGNYAGLLLVVEGTTASGQTLAAADFGPVRVLRSGREIVNASMDFLHSLTDIKGGYPPKLTGQAAQAERFGMIVPFYASGFPNVLQIEQSTELVVELDFPSVLNTRFGANAATFQLYGLQVDDVAETYEPNIVPNDQVGAGAGTVKSTLNRPNVLAVYLKDGSSVIDRVQLQVDGRNVIDNLSDAILRDLTNIWNQIETSGQNWAEMLVAENSRPETTISRSAELTTEFTGSGTVNVYVVSANWLSDSQRAANVAKVNAAIARKLASAR